LIIIGRESRHSPTIPDRYDKSLRLGQGRVVSKAATAEKESVDGITVFFQNVGPGIAYDVDFEVIKDSEAGRFFGRTPETVELALAKKSHEDTCTRPKIPFAVMKFHQELF